MSINYYLCQKAINDRWGPALSYVEFNRIDDSGEFCLHLCHTSFGWKTLFQATPIASSLKDLLTECKYSIDNSDGIIRDEYGASLTLDEFKKAILDYENTKPDIIQQNGINFVQPIAHLEYMQKTHQASYLYDHYFVDEDGYDFCSNIFS